MEDSLMIMDSTKILRGIVPNIELLKDIVDGSMGDFVLYSSRNSKINSFDERGIIHSDILSNYMRCTFEDVMKNLDPSFDDKYQISLIMFSRKVSGNLILTSMSVPMSIFWSPDPYIYNGEIITSCDAVLTTEKNRLILVPVPPRDGVEIFDINIMGKIISKDA